MIPNTSARKKATATLHNGYISREHDISFKSRTIRVGLTCDCRWAAGLFIYQTFDAIDGSVTRRHYLLRSMFTVPAESKLVAREWRDHSARCSIMVSNQTDNLDQMLTAFIRL